MTSELLQDLARHQVWADGTHWKALHENPALLEDAEIRTRLNHILSAAKTLTTLARGGKPEPGGMQPIESPDQLEAAMVQANTDFCKALASIDLDAVISLPRGPQGPFETPAWVLLLQALTHSQHHRGQNASRMRQLGGKPPMTDFIVWYATGRP